MQLGCCARIEDEAQVRAAGFDYLECPLVSLLGDEDEATFAPVRQGYNEAALPVQAFNLFLPGELKIVGPLVDQDRLGRYTERVLARARRIGAKRVVLGSGKARQIPEGFWRDEALSQIVSFLQDVAVVADQVGLIVVIEPLNRKESNVINSVAEAVEIARQVDRTAIRVLADFYHMDEENEPLSHLVDYQDWIAHIHVADSGRRAPGSGQYPYREFARLVRQIDYGGMISVECRWNDFAAEAGASIQFLRGVFG